MGLWFFSPRQPKEDGYKGRNNRDRFWFFRGISQHQVWRHILLANEFKHRAMSCRLVFDLLEASLELEDLGRYLQPLK